MDETLPADEPAPGSFDRRRFLKRTAIAGAVAVPVVSSFSMTGVNAAFAQQTNVSGRQQGSGGTAGTTTDGDASPTSDDAPTTTDDGPTTSEGSTTTSSTTAPNQVTTSSSTTLPNQTETTVTTTAVPNQP